MGSNTAPFGKRLKHLIFPLPGETDAAGEQLRLLRLVPGAVFVVAHQGEAPGCELDPDLVAAARVEPDVQQGGGAVGQPDVFQAGLFPALPLLFHHEDLVLPAVLEEKILQNAALRGRAVDQTAVLLHELSLLDQLRKLRRRRFCPGVDHHAPHIQVQTVNGENFAPQRFGNQSGDLVLRVHAHGLDDDRQFTVGIDDIHK